ncbi:uncharacterized protein C1orf112 homolog [Protopterus annectens]|uniref:uncharacterized protein C1orf112 homolog n=1 Tax=Protopterus annectens TaxID=7888 RepID=UPI001CFA557B|nr:uncharacterized protein C1orf112 homolog [Protopterus annectens]
MKTSNAMSQESLLKEISQWNEEMCQSELESALPKVVSMYQCCSGWAEHIRLLKILMEMFLPHISFTELEQSFFSQVLPKAVNLFDTLMDELSGQAGALSSQNTELRAALRNVLQTVIQLLETLSVCIRHLCSTHELLSVDSIHSLPASVLHMVKTTFTHCKESEMLYSGRMHLVADLLQALFKEAYSLQKQLMELLDRIVLEPEASEEEVVDMVSVLHNMLEICSVISNMDHALHANTWKFVIKQSLKHQSLLENHLRHNDIVCSLCQDILITFHSCLQLAEQMKLSGSQEDLNSAEYKLFQKTLKLSRFFGNTLVHYTKECMAFLAKSCSSLHQLCLQIYSKVSPGAYSSSVPETLREELARSLLVPMDPLIVQLLSYRPFVEVVLERNQELPADLTAAHCLLLISIMNKLQSEPEEVQNLWCRGSQFPEDSNRSSVIQALFLIFQGCYVELALPLLVPGVSSKGQAQNDISLYQHVCVHLCAFIASLPAPHFPELERSLLEAVLCPDISTVMLAVDAWCFLARYGTAELCAYHVTLIAHMIKRCPGSGQQVTHLALLLRRMLFLMAADHQVEFVKEFCSSETENLVLWQHISIKALTPALRKQVMQDIITGVTTQCSTWFNSGCCLQELELVGKTFDFSSHAIDLTGSKWFNTDKRKVASDFNEANSSDKGWDILLKEQLSGCEDECGTNFHNRISNTCDLTVCADLNMFSDSKQVENISNTIIPTSEVINDEIFILYNTVNSHSMCVDEICTTNVNILSESICLKDNMGFSELTTTNVNMCYSNILEMESLVQEPVEFNRELMGVDPLMNLSVHLPINMSNEDSNALNMLIVPDVDSFITEFIDNNVNQLDNLCIDMRCTNVSLGFKECGFNFIPSRKGNMVDLLMDLKLLRKMNLKQHFNDDNFINTDQRNKLVKPSIFNPVMNPTVTLFERLCEQNIRQYYNNNKWNKSYNNMTDREYEILEEISNMSNVRIMKPDKGNGVVITNKQDYISILMAMLCEDNYTEMSLNEINIAFRRIDMNLEDMLMQDEINEDDYEYLLNKFRILYVNNQLAGVAKHSASIPNPLEFIDVVTCTLPAQGVGHEGGIWTYMPQNYFAISPVAIIECGSEHSFSCAGYRAVFQVLNQPTIQKTLRLLLHLTANFIKTTLAHLVPQVVSFLDIFYPSNPTDDIQVAIGDFLASLGKIFLPPDCQAQVIPKLSSLFASLLENRSWIVFQHVLEAFVQFAEETSHEEVVPQSLLKVEVKSKVISFLNKTLPLVACDEESQLDRLKQEKSVLHAHFCRIRSNVLDDKPEDFQPSSKRARQETAEEGQFETALDMAESGLHSLESLLLSSPAPSWVALRLQALQTLVDKLNSKVQQNLLTQTTPLISDV